MVNISDVINVTGLDDHELGHIEFVLNSPAYGDHFAPYLTRIRNSLNYQLLDPDNERKQKLPDDFLRGGIAVVDGLLTLFAQLVSETHDERMIRSQQHTTEDIYQRLREQGRVRPAGQTEQPVQYSPEEDY